MLVQLGFNHLGSSIYNLPPSGASPIILTHFVPKRLGIMRDEGEPKLWQEGRLALSEGWGMYGRLDCPDALAARPRKPKSLLYGRMDSSNRGP